MAVFLLCLLWRLVNSRFGNVLAERLRQNSLRRMAAIGLSAYPLQAWSPSCIVRHGGIAGLAGFLDGQCDCALSQPST